MCVNIFLLKLCVCINVHRWKKNGLQKMILFIELFAHLKHFSFSTFIRTCELINPTLRWFSVIPGHLLEVGLPLCRDTVSIFSSSLVCVCVCVCVCLRPLWLHEGLKKTHLMLTNNSMNIIIHWRSFFFLHLCMFSYCQIYFQFFTDIYLIGWFLCLMAYQPSWVI